MNGAAPPSALRGFLGLSRPWLRRWRTRGAILLLLLLTAAQVAFAVAYNLWNARLFDALEQRDAAALWREVGIFGVLVLGIVLSNAAQLAARRGVALSWRRALTAQLLEGWLAEGRHWRLAQLPDGPDNPDGRVAEDIRIATEHAVEMLSTLFFSVNVLVAMAGILWSLSGLVTVAGLAVPGHVVWLALLYAGAGAVAAFTLGRPLTDASEARQKAEADLRFGLAQIREQGAALALARGEAPARAGVMRRFETMAGAWHRQTRGLRNLTGFQSAYSTLAPFFPLIVSAPRYLAGNLTLGGLMQIGQGFQQAVVALSWPVDNAAKFAEWHASADRVLALVEAAEAVGAAASGVAIADGGETLAMSGLILRQPDGTALARPLDIALPRGARVGVVGEEAAVDALFLALAGVWPWGEGTLRRPAPGGIFVLPRRPLLPEAPLRQLLVGAAAVPDEALAAALDVVGLPAMAARLDDTAEWSALLDDSSRVRAAFAQLLLARPHLVLLEDLVGVLGQPEATRLVGILTLSLPEAIVLAVDHGALGFEQRLELMPAVGVPRGRAAQAAARRQASQFAARLRRGFGHDWR